GEDEALHPRDAALQREEELQEQAAVEIHRAGDVAEGDDPRLARLALAKAEVEQLGHRPPQGAAQIEAAPARSGLPAPAGPQREPAREPSRDPLHLGKLLGAEGAEVLLRKRGHVARGRHGLGLLLLALALLAASREGAERRGGRVVARRRAPA